MTRDLCTFALSPKQLGVLKNGGFVREEDLLDISPSQLKDGMSFKFCLQ